MRDASLDLESRCSLQSGDRESCRSNPLAACVPTSLQLRKTRADPRRQTHAGASLVSARDMIVAACVAAQNREPNCMPRVERRIHGKRERERETEGYDGCIIHEGDERVCVCDRQTVSACSKGGAKSLAASLV